MNKKQKSLVLLGPYIALLLFNAFIIFIPDSMLFYLDEIRPPYGNGDLNVHTQKQMLHLHALERKRDVKNRIVFVGSSSVVNGIDTKIIQKKFSENEFHFYPMNYGLTAFRALELPFLKKQFLADEIDIIVYLYNTFSFGSILDLDKVNTRWDSSEYKIISGQQADKYLIFKMRSKAIFPIGSFGDLIINYIKRLFLMDLKSIEHEYDYSDVEERDYTMKPRVKMEPMPDNNWLRKSYVESDTDETTLGYRGLERFLSLAKLKGKTVVVAPIPEPAFSSFGRYRQDINVDRIDRHAQRIVEKNGAIFFSRDKFKYIENDDSNFIDDVHLNNFGRQEFSEKLSNLLLSII